MPTESSFGADLRCPDDGHLLRVEISGKVRFAVCRHCDGLWFSREAISGPDKAVLPDKSSRPRGGEAPNTVRRCPSCNATMKAVKAEDATIDECDNCGGVWLDAGEYKAARRRVIRARVEKMVPSARGPKTAIGRAWSWFVDLVGEVYVENTHVLDIIDNISATGNPDGSGPPRNRVKR